MCQIHGSSIFQMLIGQPVLIYIFINLYIIYNFVLFAISPSNIMVTNVSRLFDCNKNDTEIDLSKKKHNIYNTFVLPCGSLLPWWWHNLKSQRTSQ